MRGGSAKTSGWFHVSEAADSPKPDRNGRVHAGEALGPTEDSFRLIVETIPGLIAVMTPSGEVEHVNSQVLWRDSAAERQGCRAGIRRARDLEHRV